MDQHITIINDPSSGIAPENEFAIADTWYIDAYSDGDWNGAAGVLARFFSDTPGFRVTLDISAIGEISASYCNFQDIAIVGGTVYADETCQGAYQNNDGIVFAGGDTVAALASGDAFGISLSISL